MKQKILIIVGLMILATVSAAPNAANGKNLYHTYCQNCHGVGAVGIKGAKGVIGVGPALKGEVAGWKFDAFKRAILIGVDDEGKTLAAAMPRWGQIGFSGKKPTDAQLKDLQAYLKTLK